MVNDRLQPKRTVLAVSVLLAWVGVLGLAAGAGGAGESFSAPMPSTIKVKPKTPSTPAEPMDNQALARGSSKRPGAAETRVPDAGPVRVPSAEILSTAAGRRDPFKPWEPSGSPGHHAADETSGALLPGIRGLVISQLRVVGIVRQESPNTMIAVVTNYTKRAYFLRENDVVYNGVVSKITPDAVYFKENTLGSTGRVGTHEVEMRLGSAVGEGR